MSEDFWVSASPFAGNSMKKGGAEPCSICDKPVVWRYVREGQPVLGFCHLHYGEARRLAKVRNEQ